MGFLPSKMYLSVECCNLRVLTAMFRVTSDPWYGFVRKTL